MTIFLICSCNQKRQFIKQKPMQIEKISCYQHEEPIKEEKPNKHLNITDKSSLVFVKYFSREGNIEKAIFFDKEGNVEYTIRYEYDNSDRLVSEIPIDTDLFSGIDYEYNEEKNLTISSRKDKSEIWHFYDDSRGNRLSTQSVNLEGDILFKLDYHYGTNGLLVASDRYDSGMKTQTQSFIYDESKRLTETKTFNMAGQLVLIETQNFTSQNEIEKIKKDIKKGIQRKSRMIQFNDVYKNKIKLYMMSGYEADKWQVSQYVNEYY